MRPVCGLERRARESRVSKAQPCTNCDRHRGLGARGVRLEQFEQFERRKAAVSSVRNTHPPAVARRRSDPGHPGSPFLAWVNQQIGRFQTQNPGWKIQTSLLPFDNGATQAKLGPPSASHSGPDMMSLYSGQFTNAYTQAAPAAQQVRAPGDAGLYSSIPEGVWNIECVPDYTCNGGKNTILGVPWNSGAYYLFYNKALLAKAGISGPPATYKELFADCASSAPKGITASRWGPTTATTRRTYWTSEPRLDAEAGRHRRRCSTGEAPVQRARGSWRR